MISFFYTHKNFLTTKLEPKSINKLPKMIPVTELKDLTERTTAMMNLATVAHEIISLQFFCMHIIKSTKQLGELYVKHPHHFCHIFSMLEALGTRIKENITQCKLELAQIAKSDMNTMQLQAQESLPDEFQEIFTACYTTIAKLGSDINDYRNRVAKGLNPNEPTEKSVKWEMFTITKILANMYELKTDECHKPEPSVIPLSLWKKERKAPIMTLTEEADSKITNSVKGLL